MATIFGEEALSSFLFVEILGRGRDFCVVFGEFFLRFWLDGSPMTLGIRTNAQIKRRNGEANRMNELSVA